MMKICLNILPHVLIFFCVPLIGMQPSLYTQWQQGITGQLTYLQLLEALEGADLTQLRAAATQQGININTLFGPDGISLLHLAVTHKKADLVGNLLSLGADPFLVSHENESASDILYIQESTCEHLRRDSDARLKEYRNDKQKSEDSIKNMIAGFKKLNGSDELTESQKKMLTDLFVKNRKIFRDKHNDVKKFENNTNNSLEAIKKMQALFAQARIKKRFCDGMKSFAGVCGVASSASILFAISEIFAWSVLRKNRLKMIQKKALHLKNSLFSFDFDPYAPKIPFCDDINASTLDSLVANDQRKDDLKKSVQQFNDVAARVEAAVCGAQYLYHPISHFYEKEMVLVQEFEDAYMALRKSIDVCILDINSEMLSRVRLSVISVAGAATSFFIFTQAHWTKKWGFL